MQALPTPLQTIFNDLTENKTVSNACSMEVDCFTDNRDIDSYIKLSGIRIKNYLQLNSKIGYLISFEAEKEFAIELHYVSADTGFMIMERDLYNKAQGLLIADRGELLEIVGTLFSYAYAKETRLEFLFNRLQPLQGSSINIHPIDADNYQAPHILCFELHGEIDCTDSVNLGVGHLNISNEYNLIRITEKPSGVIEITQKCCGTHKIGNVLEWKGKELSPLLDILNARLLPLFK